MRLILGILLVGLTSCSAGDENASFVEVDVQPKICSEHCSIQEKKVANFDYCEYITEKNETCEQKPRSAYEQCMVKEVWDCFKKNCKAEQLTCDSSNRACVFKNILNFSCNQEKPLRSRCNACKSELARGEKENRGCSHIESKEYSSPEETLCPAS